MDAQTHQPKRQDYSEILDMPLAPKARRIAVSLLTAKDNAEVQQDTGASERYVHTAMQETGITGLTAGALMQKQQKLDKMLVVLQDIIDKEPETPLKYSDKLKAIELSAKLSGITEDKGDTYNVGIFDLRNATEEELVKELARIENNKRNVIDVTPLQ